MRDSRNKVFVLASQSLEFTGNDEIDSERIAEAMGRLVERFGYTIAKRQDISLNNRDFRMVFGVETSGWDTQILLRVYTP